MIIELNTDSPEWLAVRHTLREAGYKVFLQPVLFDPNRANLFLERRAEEPEGGELRHGFVIYDGGAPIDSHVHEVYEQEVAK